MAPVHMQIFFHARSLAKLGHFGMPGAYDEAVEKLIRCKFDCGNDLSKLDLHVAFHRDTVSPLEEAEEQLRMLRLDV